MLKYSFSDQIRSELLNPEIYALIDMRIAREFRRSHSLALWENTVRYEGIGITAKIPLPKFRDLILGHGQGVAVVQGIQAVQEQGPVPCIQEVNEVSDHTLELIEHKSGRSVEAVQFKVTRKQSTDTVEDGDVKNEALVEEVAKFGIPRSEARRLITQYGVQRIKAAIAYTLNRTTKKNAAPVDNVAAYFRKALTHGYTLSDGQGTEAAAPAKESAQSKQEQIRDKYLAAKVEEAGAYFRELEIDDQTKLIERYNETVAGSKDLTLSPKRRASSRRPASSDGSRWIRGANRPRTTCWNSC